MPYTLNQKVLIPICRSEASLDRASDSAYRLALLQFNVDDCGHINGVMGAERSEHAIYVEFKKYLRIEHDHHYEFEAWVE